MLINTSLAQGSKGGKLNKRCLSPVHFFTGDFGQWLQRLFYKRLDGKYIRLCHSGYNRMDAAFSIYPLENSLQGTSWKTWFKNQNPDLSWCKHKSLWLKWRKEICSQKRVGKTVLAKSYCREQGIRPESSRLELFFALLKMALVTLHSHSDLQFRMNCEEHPAHRTVRPSWMTPAWVCSTSILLFPATSPLSFSCGYCSDSSSINYEVYCGWLYLFMQRWAGNSRNFVRVGI